MLVLKLMREKWAAMVTSPDATGTVWESFDQAKLYDGSYCHNSGAGPAYFLSAWVLGVRLDGPVEKRRLMIEPRLGDLSRVSGVVVTELGLVPVSWRRKDETLSFKFQVPSEAKARVTIPYVGKPRSLTVNGRNWLTAEQTQIHNVRTENGHLFFDVGPGAYEGSLSNRKRG